MGMSRGVYPVIYPKTLPIRLHVCDKDEQFSLRIGLTQKAHSCPGSDPIRVGGTNPMKRVTVRVACLVLIFALAVLLLASARVLTAQLATGTILGVVTDSTGATVPDANVTVTNTSTNEARTATTDSEGSYRFDALQPGPYSVTV